MDTTVATPALPEHPVIVIEATRGWRSLGLRDVWEYRDLLYLLTWRDLKARYRQMALGPLWILAQPLINMVLYTVIFGVIANLPSDGVPYPIFTYVALLPWGFFAGVLASTVGSLLGATNLISKVYFPRLVLPLSLLLSNLVDFLISFIILAGMLLFYRIMPNWWAMLWLPFYMLLAALTGLGVGLWFAGILVKYRDVGQVTGYLTRGWMYATPVVYSITIIPAAWLTLYSLNPMTQVVEGFRWALLGMGLAPNWITVVSTALTLLVLVGGLFIFKRAERNIADIL